MSLAAAESYRAAIRAGGGRIAEVEPSPPPGGELELQARWFGGEFGCDHFTTDGARISIEDFGRWNHEAGPDFIDTRVRVDNQTRRGAIEIDLDVRDWERHGHATNLDFRETVLHVFIRESGPRFFTRTCDHRHVPQMQLAVPLTPADSLHPIPEPVTTDGHLAGAILRAAARHRLALKAAALARYAAAHGRDEAWFAALAAALGYKHNQIPFALLAQRVTVRSASESLLFGVAGFLESPEPPAAAAEVRAYLRGLWERWWAERARCERWILPRSAWRFGGVRPANHPHRRVAALAAIVRDWRNIRAALEEGEAAAVAEGLRRVHHEFWEHRFTLSSAKMKRPGALIGPGRIRDILCNLYFPAAVERDETAWKKFLAERGPAPPAAIRSTAQRFFGGLPAEFFRPAARQQGLLQLERDHRLAPDPAAYREALRRMSRG